MATEASGDSTSPKPMTTPSKGFCFRPSALSDVADKIWKKSSADTNSSTSGTDAQPKLFALSSLSSASGSNNNPLFTSSSATPSSPFIFGKNISRRVAHVADNNGNGDSGTVAEKESKEDTDSNEKTQSENNGRTGVSFDILAATSTTTDTTADSNGVTSTTTASDAAGPVSEDAAAALEASAAAYEAAKHQTQKQPQLLAPEEVKTGEEDEVNLLQASVKLFVFDTAKQSWTDRGLAIIRVNDRRITSDDGEHQETRIVVRLQGSLRVIVNTKLWPDMLLERVSPKRLRMSGTVEDTALVSNEAEQVPAISIYLISASQSADIDRIERLLRDRLVRMRGSEQRPSSAAGKKRPFPQSDDLSSSNDSDQVESSAKKRVEEEGDK